MRFYASILKRMIKFENYNKNSQSLSHYYYVLADVYSVLFV